MARKKIFQCILPKMLSGDFRNYHYLNQLKLVADSKTNKSQLKVMTAADYRHIMKIAIFALDEIFDEWNQITYKELCELYAKFNKMYITSKQELYTENDLNKFEIKS